jgi:hypothetical protein
MIPLYGFLEGDTMGLLVLVGEDETVATLGRRLQEASALRVGARGPTSVWTRGMPLSASATVGATGLQALDRFDVRFDVRFGVPADARGDR